MSLDMMQRLAIIVPFVLCLIMYFKTNSVAAGLSIGVLFFGAAQFFMMPMKQEVKKEAVYSRFESKSPEDKFASIEFKKCMNVDRSESNSADCRVSVGNLAEQMNGKPFKEKVVTSLSELTSELDKS